MAKHATEIYTTDELLDRIWDGEDISDFPELIDAESGDSIAPNNSFYALAWPDHCVTTQHLNDATIHGPFDSRDDAELI